MKSGPQRLKSLEERFWAKVRKGPGCWLWTAATNNRGYGKLSRGGRNAGLVYAHRLSYEMHHGPVPADADVMHSCDTPACVRPDHLSTGTRLDNMRDAKAKGRIAHGFRKPHTILSQEQKAVIRKAYRADPRRAGAGNAQHLAVLYGVSSSHIYNIASGYR